MPIWATHPRIQEGELLSSWLIRIASECGMTLPEFCKATLPVPKRQVLGPQVIDRNPADDLLLAISNGTGVSLDRIRQATMLSEEGYLFTQSGDGQLRWIAPTHSVQTAKYDNTPGLPYCPECLSGDKKPHYRKIWRYSFISVCPIHRKPLRNACPHCKKPYSNLIPFAHNYIDLCNPIAGCWSCHRDIRKTSTESTLDEGLLSAIVAIQDEILTGVNQGYFNVPGHGYVYSRAYLNGLYGILQTLTLGKNTKDRLKYLVTASGIELSHKIKSANITGKAEFDRSIAEDRVIYLYLAWWLMGEWPERLNTYAEELKLKLFLAKLRQDPTFWISNTIPPATNKLVSPLSDEEFESAKRILKKRLNRPLPYYDVSQHEVMVFIRDCMKEPSGPKPRIKGSRLPASIAFSKNWADEREVEKQRKIALLDERDRIQRRNFEEAMKDPKFRKKVDEF